MSGIDLAKEGAERTVVQLGGPVEAAAFGFKFLREILPGETYRWYGDGIIICHPDREPMYSRIEGGVYKQEPIKPS